MSIIPSTPTGLTRSAADARYPLLIDVAVMPGASKIPRAGVDGKLDLGWLPDLSGTYAPLVHTHDDRYFTESEIIAGYAPLVHIHDDRYYTEAEIGALLAGYAALVHTHAAADVVSGTLDNARVNWGAPGAIGATTPNTISGSSLNIAPDTAVATTLGRVRVGDISSGDIGYFAHYDFFDANSYAVYQNSSGNTRINAPSGQVVSLRVANTSVLSVTGSSILGNQPLSVLADTDAATILGRARIDSRSSDRAYFSHYDMSTTGQYALFQTATGTTYVGAASGAFIGFGIGGIDRAAISATGLRVGDASAAVTILHAVTSDAVTNASTNVLTLGHNSSGTPAASFGTGLLFQGESSTTENRDMGRIRTLWTTATDASRISGMRLSVFNVGVEVDVLILGPTLTYMATNLEVETTSAAFVYSQVRNLGTGTAYTIIRAAVGGGDTYTQYIAGALSWAIGVDVSDSSKFKISNNANLGTNDYLTINTSGLVGILTSAPSAALDINSDVLRLRTAKTPASAGSAGNQGDICWDSNFVYVCVAASTWKRAALSTW